MDYELLEELKLALKDLKDAQLFVGQALTRRLPRDIETAIRGLDFELDLLITAIEDGDFLSQARPDSSPK